MLNVGEKSKEGRKKRGKKRKGKKRGKDGDVRLQVHLGMLSFKLLSRSITVNSKP